VKPPAGQRFDRDRDQVVSVDVSVLKVMPSREFRVGIAEVRAGKPPQFDEEDDWNYERGRQFGIIAPANMDPRSDMAIRLFSAAVRRGYIV
jgi:hypothetical protein